MNHTSLIHTSTEASYNTTATGCVDYTRPPGYKLPAAHSERVCQEFWAKTPTPTTETNIMHDEVNEKQNHKTQLRLDRNK